MMEKSPKFDMKRLIWQPVPGREHEIDAFAWDEIAGETVHVGHVFTELGCAGYWHCWDDYAGSQAKDRKYHGRCVDATNIGLIGAIQLIENKWKEVSK